MNRNYFCMSTDELCFLVMCQETDRLIGFDARRADWDIEKLESCAAALTEKGYLFTEEGKQKIHSRLNSWMYVAAHPQGAFLGISSDGERMLVYFYEESIVSIHIKGDLCELIWLPFIHLAIGQVADIVQEENCRDWRFQIRYSGNDPIEEYVPSENETLIDIMNHISKFLLAAHGYAIGREQQ